MAENESATAVAISRAPTAPRVRSNSIAPFTETPGTFVNAEGRIQSFHAVVKPLGEARPGCPA